MDTKISSSKLRTRTRRLGVDRRSGAERNGTTKPDRPQPMVVRLRTAGLRRVDLAQCCACLGTQHHLVLVHDIVVQLKAGFRLNTLPG